MVDTSNSTDAGEPALLRWRSMRTETSGSPSAAAGTPIQGPTINVAHLSKSFGHIEAVKDLSFTVKPGRVTAFLGPNGAGKTTTLRMLLGLVRPDAGTATFNQTPYVDITDPLQEVGSHLSADAFNPGRSGRDHLEYMAAGSGIALSRTAELLDLVGLGKDADRRVGGYSLGMRQRLGLAAALLGDPPALVLDEPGTGLDPAGMSWLRSFLHDLAGQGRTVFLSSHLLGEVQQFADDLVIINRGHLVAAGSARDLEHAGGGRVLVDSTDREHLLKALRTAGLEFIDEGGPAIQVLGTNASDVGNLALVTGVPLSHLSEEVAGLEDLFLGLVGDGQ